jgi:hypothetical protein
VSDDRLRWWDRAGRSLNDDDAAPRLKGASFPVVLAATKSQVGAFGPFWLQMWLGEADGSGTENGASVWTLEPWLVAKGVFRGGQRTRQ